MPSSMKVRFLIDKEEKRVVYVEAGSDFVDVLFSFLTLPLGAIVRLLKMPSGLGSLDSLYESIEQLDAEHLQTEACKEMLLNPRSAAAVLCEDLKVKRIHELNPRTNYTCSQDGCLIHSTCYFTFQSKVLCSRCGKLMDKTWQWHKQTSKEGGVFVKATAEFMITDDLRVMPASLLKSLSLLKEMHIKDTSMLEERVMQFGTKEVSHLSYNFLIVDDEAQNEIKVELILNKKNNSLLYAQVGDDFTNHLFSFLAFPLGSVLKFLSDNMSPLGGCIQNLYSSIENMGLEYFKSEICRNMLLTPKLAAFFWI
ncbi:hypothetical protein KSP39_PZI022657 [Platanthera zijinensis]|uniref:DUF674 family protein n=1 Tax=Platanthera zijinensis TaxID=2320716 RepID=A0AAP0AWC1_9ASPA